MEMGKLTLNRILEEKVPAAFTACFAPRCSNFGVPVTHLDIDQSDGESTRHEALLRMEINVKKHISTVIHDNVSLMTDGDEALLSELEVSFEHDDQESTSDFTNLNTIGEETLHDIENRRGENKSAVTRVTPRLPNLPGAYKQSVKSKFDYYRQHQLFNASALRPIDENSESEGQVGDSVKSTCEKNTSIELSEFTAKSQDSKLSLPLSSGNEDDQPEAAENNTSSLDSAQLTTEVEESTLFSPSSKRGELAKQILQRRQSQPQSPSRVTIDP